VLKKFSVFTQEIRINFEPEKPAPPPEKKDLKQEAKHGAERYF
jgi:hypothetical protein